MDITTARVEVLSIALLAIARALAPAQAAQVADEVCTAVAILIRADGAGVTPDLDEAIAVQVHAILQALQV